MLENVPSDDLSRLLRWVDAGGEWRASNATADSADIQLVTCAGHEVMETFSSAAPDVLAYVAARSTGGSGSGVGAEVPGKGDERPG